MQLTGYNLLEQVEQIDPTFISGPPWRGKESIIEKCGYHRIGSDGKLSVDREAFHQAYEDARIFRGRYGDEIQEQTFSPQEIFESFIYIFHEFPTVDVEAHVTAHGLDSVIELAEQLREYELGDEE
jgi:hypothetical protein